MGEETLLVYVFWQVPKWSLPFCIQSEPFF